MRYLVVLAACSGSAPIDRAVEEPGPSAVGTARFELRDDARARDLVAQAWFPTGAAAGDIAIETLDAEPIRARYAATLAAAPPACPTRTLPVALDAPPAGAGLPLVVLSHCHSCTRLSNASIAVRLASHGFAVVAVDHSGDTLWERLDGTEAELDREELDRRAADLSFVLDEVAAGGTPLGGSVDLARAGVLGHSMGAVTAGRTAQLDARIGAAAALAAPMENPFIPGVELAEIAVPMLFVVAVEDNSITEFGNDFIRDNFAAAQAPAVKLEIPDAGHWSVSDLAGLVDLFAPGCGEGERQTDGFPFTYLDAATGRAIAASYATAFFRAELLDDAGARGYLHAASATFGVALDVAHRDP